MSDECESVQSLLARRASVQELLQNGAVNAEIVRGTLVLKNGSASLYDLKELLKKHGCKFDPATKTWRRPGVATVAERHAVSALKARVKLKLEEKDRIIDLIIAHVNKVDAQVRDSTWVGMPCNERKDHHVKITDEARARAWAVHGLPPPTKFGGRRRDVYGNYI